MIANRFVEFSGKLYGTNKLTIGNGSAKNRAIIQIGNPEEATNPLGYDAPLNINEGEGGTALYILRTFLPWTIQKEIPTSQRLRSLMIDNNNP